MSVQDIVSIVVGGICLLIIIAFIIWGDILDKKENLRKQEMSQRLDEIVLLLRSLNDNNAVKNSAVGLLSNILESF